jgi:hypothetical protein
MINAIRLIDFEDNKVTLTVHCYNLTFLKSLIEAYPKDAIKVMSYVFYMSYPGPENPYMNIPEEHKSNLIVQDLGLDISLDDPLFITAIEKCQELYKTPINRMYHSLSNALNKISNYFDQAEITDGKDGNLTQIINAAKNYGSIRDSFKKIKADFDEETKLVNWGGKDKAYDL